MFSPTFGKGTGSSVPPRCCRQRISSVKVGTYRSSLPKVTPRGRSISMSERLSVSVDKSGTSLPASSRCTVDWCESAASSGSAVAPVPPPRWLAQCQFGGLVWHLRQHLVPSRQSVRFGVTPTGGPLAGTTLHHVRKSPRAHVGPHRQVLLQAKLSSRPKVPRGPVYV